MFCLGLCQWFFIVLEALNSTSFTSFRSPNLTAIGKNKTLVCILSICKMNHAPDLRQTSQTDSPNPWGLIKPRWISTGQCAHFLHFHLSQCTTPDNCWFTSFGSKLKGWGLESWKLLLRVEFRMLSLESFKCKVETQYVCTFVTSHLLHNVNHAARNFFDRKSFKVTTEGGEVMGPNDCHWILKTTRLFWSWAHKFTSFVIKSTSTPVKNDSWRSACRAKFILESTSAYSFDFVRERFRSTAAPWRHAVRLLYSVAVRFGK